MGCDGGSIPRRDEMVKLKKKAQKADKDMELQARWKYCALSGEELKQPVVACELGRIYNKEAVLMALLDKSNIPEVARHIRSLKDVTVLQLTLNPSYKPTSNAGAYNDTQTAQHACPVTGLEMSGRYKFVYLRGCGCVISEKALKEVPSKTCHKCGCEFTMQQVVPLNVSEEEEKALREGLEERRRQARLAKRKRKACSTENEATASTTGATASGSGTSSGSDKESPPPPEKKQKLPQPSSESVTPSSSEPRPKAKSKSGQSSQASVTNGALASQPTPVGARSLSKLHASAGDSDSSAAERDKVLEMAESRKVYKSLFTSNAGERPKEQTSNWVTFFPYH